MSEQLAQGERKLLIVDPCESCREVMPFLTSAGWSIESTSLDATPGHQCDVGLIRLRASHVENPESVKRLVRSSGTEWIALVDRELMTRAGSNELIGQWFFDFHTLPLDPQRLRFAVGRALGMARVRRLCNRPSAMEDADALVGNSQEIRTLRGLIVKLAPCTSPVLITGESGTGKELVARSLHRLSKRSKGPFMAVNCGAVASNLIQSELFGHEKGAFTGAYQRKIGRIEAAHGGTLFLDEIGDLSLELQANLLRFLQEMTIERVGGHSTIKVDVRVLAATHVDLEKAVAEGRFREDLYYRLNVMLVHTVPLRRRTVDIPLLAEHFSQLYAHEVGRRPRRFSSGAIEAMLAYTWPGNIRELANRVRRGQVLAEGPEIQAEDIGLTSPAAIAHEAMTLDDYLLQAERKAINDALTRCSQHMTRAANLLGISRATLYRLLHKHNILEEGSRSA